MAVLEGFVDHVVVQGGDVAVPGVGGGAGVGGADHQLGAGAHPDLHGLDGGGVGQGEPGVGGGGDGDDRHQQEGQGGLGLVFQFAGLIADGHEAGSPPFGGEVVRERRG